MDYGWEDNERDPLVHFYAHWDQLSEAARTVIIEKAPIVANSGLPLSQCDVIAPIWYHFFKAAGVAVDLRGGAYSFEADANDVYPSSREHTWLEVEGEIFDPTASQFKTTHEWDPAAHEFVIISNEINEEYYRTTVADAADWFDGEDPSQWSFQNQLTEHNRQAHEL